MAHIAIHVLKDTKKVHQVLMKIKERLHVRHAQMDA